MMWALGKNLRSEASAPWRWAIVGGGVIYLSLSLIDQLKQQSETLESVITVQTAELKKLATQITSRTYLTLTRAKIESNNRGAHTLILSIKNNSTLVEDVVSRLLVLEGSLNQTKGPIHTKRFESANPVGPGGAFDRQLAITVTKSTPPLFVVFQIRFTNPSSKNTHSQDFFLEFPGVRPDGMFKSNLNDAGLNGKARIEQYMKEQNIPPL